MAFRSPLNMAPYQMLTCSEGQPYEHSLLVSCLRYQTSDIAGTPPQDCVPWSLGDASTEADQSSIMPL